MLENENNWQLPGSEEPQIRVNKMISISKLYKEGRMYMNSQEIQAIERGQLSEYLS